MSFLPKKSYVALDRWLGYESVNAWLKKVTDKRNALYVFDYYMRWRTANGLPVDPDAMVKECVEGNNRTLIQHLEVLMEYAEGGIPERYYYVVRSFYKRNHVSLPEEPFPRKAEPSEVSLETTATDFVSMLTKVLQWGKVSVMNRSVFLTQLQYGLDDSTLAYSFNHVAFPQFVKHFGTDDFAKWDERKVPVRVDLVRPKTAYRYYSFGARDFITELKAWLAVRYAQFGPVRTLPNQNPKLLPRSDPIYLNQYARGVNAPLVCRFWREAGKRAGVNVRPEGPLDSSTGAALRYPFHGHECRDSLVTLAVLAGVPEPVANFWIGHNIDARRYNKSPWEDPGHYSTNYCKVMPFLNVLSGDAERAELSAESKVVQYEKRLREQEERLARLEQNQRMLLEHPEMAKAFRDHSDQK